MFLVRENVVKREGFQTCKYLLLSELSALSSMIIFNA